MKKIIISICIVAVVALFVYNAHSFSLKNDTKQQWIESASKVAAMLDTKTSAKFLSKKQVKIAGEAEMRTFNRDTLYVRFNHQDAADASLNYVDGVLYITGQRINFSDTGKALSLMYGISRHIIQSQGINYGKNLEQDRMDKVRAEQYVFDVMYKIGGIPFKKLLDKECSRQFRTYMQKKQTLDAYSIPDTLYEGVFKNKLTDLELLWMDLNTQKSAAFINCDRIYGDNEDGWDCKLNAQSAIELANIEIKLK